MQTSNTNEGMRNEILENMFFNKEGIYEERGNWLWFGNCNMLDVSSKAKEKCLLFM